MAAAGEGLERGSKDLVVGLVTPLYKTPLVCGGGLIAGVPASAVSGISL